MIHGAQGKLQFHDEEQEQKGLRERDMEIFSGPLKETAGSRVGIKKDAWKPRAPRELSRQGDGERFVFFNLQPHLMLIMLYGTVLKGVLSN